jgi:hypothetical protein
MPIHAYLIMREFMLVSHSIATSYSIRTLPYAVYHSLSGAKYCLQELRDLIGGAEPAWTIETSHVRQADSETLPGFTVQDQMGMVVQVAWVERVRIGDECGS